jgi:hypothetical protein
MALTSVYIRGPGGEYATNVDAETVEQAAEKAIEWFLDPFWKGPKPKAGMVLRIVRMGMRARRRRQKTLKILTVRLLVVLALMAPRASAITRKFRLYDTQTGQKSEAAFKFRWSSTAGTAEATIEGDKVSGEYSISQSGSFGWGSIYSGGKTATMNGVSIGGGKGALIMTGPSGLVLECEFVTNAVTTHGNGGCKDNQGALYRLIF